MGAVGAASAAVLIFNVVVGNAPISLSTTLGRSSSATKPDPGPKSVQSRSRSSRVQLSDTKIEVGPVRIDVNAPDAVVSPRGGDRRLTWKARIMNTGDAVTSVLSTDFTIVDSDHRPRFPVGRFAHFLPAGEGKDVVLAFDIPTDVRPTLLRVDLLDGDSVEVDLTVP